MDKNLQNRVEPRWVEPLFPKQSSGTDDFETKKYTDARMMIII